MVRLTGTVAVLPSPCGFLLRFTIKLGSIFLEHAPLLYSKAIERTLEARRRRCYQESDPYLLDDTDPCVLVKIDRIFKAYRRPDIRNVVGYGRCRKK